MDGILQAGKPPSLPSRGAWIEIGSDPPEKAKAEVAPLAGSVDRNVVFVVQFGDDLASLPSRGAWIEIIRKVGVCNFPLSLPSRGAWIEIHRGQKRRFQSV